MEQNKINFKDITTFVKKNSDTTIWNKKGQFSQNFEIFTKSLLFLKQSN